MSEKKVATLLLKQYSLLETMQDNLNIFLTKSPVPTDGYIRAKLAGVDAIWTDFKSNHEQLITLFTKETINEEDYFKNKIYAKAEDLYCEVTAQYEEKLPNGGKIASKEETGGKPKIKLPIVNVPAFDGNVRDWCSFSSLFRTLIHDRQDLSDVERLHYLKGSVTGEANKMIKHFDITGPNYKAAWRLLCDRYENPRIMVDALLSTLTSLPIIKTESISAFKNMVDTVHECLYSLKNLNIPVSTWDPMLLHLLVPKLPPVTIREWEKEVGPSKLLPSLAKFLEFLTNTFQVMESSKRVGAGSNTACGSTGSGSKIRTFLTSSQEVKKCPMCDSTHSIRYCPAFRQMTVQGRHDFLRNKFICRNCLSLFHSTAQCPSNLNCKHCQRRHHSLLHLTNIRGNQPTETSLSTKNSDSRAPSVAPVASYQHAATPSQSDRGIYETSPAAKVSTHAGTMEDFASSLAGRSLLATAVFHVSSNGRCLPVRALVDPGSQATFVTTRIVQMLHATTQSVSVRISGLGGIPIGSPVSRVTLDIGSRTVNDFNISSEMLVLPKLTQLLPSHRITISDKELCRQFTLADPHFDVPGQIDMLLGVDVYAQIILPGLHSLTNGLKIQATQLGWIIFGSTRERNTYMSQPENYITGLHSYIEDDYQLRRFWELEAVPTDNDTSKSPDPCEQHYVETTVRRPDGRYQVKLPFRDQMNTLGRTGHIAKAAFLRLERRLLQSPALYKQYQECLAEYVTMGHMQLANASEQQYVLSDGRHTAYRCYYMPHHGITKESSTTKLRVVFNASQKSENGNSLNDILYTGTRLQNEIASILIQWRSYPIAFTADIAKMYRQIPVHPSDYAFQRILWRSDPSLPITEYELKTVTFGVTTAPYLAIRTLHQLALDEGEQSPLAAKHLRENFYVDDYLGGGFEVHSAENLISELRSLLKAGGFTLRKWVANCPEVLFHVPVGEREMIESEDPTVSVIKTLGVKWNPDQDHLYFEVPAFQDRDPVTKRSILSWIAGLYDPLGLLAPVIINCKLFMQKLWIAGLQWDEPVGESLFLEWRSITQRCQTTQPIIISRWSHFGTESIMELHGFCDASKGAYAAVLYLRATDIHGRITSRIIISKTRVAPTKTVTIPRLELCGAVLLVKLMNYIRKQAPSLDLPLTLWTDSQVVLAWLNRESGNWTTFVANRVSFIQTHTNPADWSYVRSTDNPADVATRGLSAVELSKNPLWWSGPPWLSNPTYEKCQPSLKAYEVPRETETPSILSCHTTVDLCWLTKFSSLTRLLRVTAYILRFIRACKPNGSRELTSTLSSSALAEATQLCVRAVQETSFSAEKHALINGRPLPSKSPLLNLNPFVDQHDILRVGGRLANSEFTYSEKHPIVLPSQHHYTVLVVQHAHTQTLHGGTEMTSGYIRATYWILRSRSTIRKILHKCVVCFRHRQHSSNQIMADLPRERVVRARPFTYTGVDYAGPITLKAVGMRSTKTFKGYIAVFVCFSIKAFHLELVSDLTQNAFLAAFRRFIARRGVPHTMFSDCGTNFVGAKNTLAKYETEAIEYCSTRGVEWKFIPPASPHFGGLWEAGVKLVKTHLKKTLGTTVLNFEEYTTLLTQIEACLNSRPLCPITNDACDYAVLTPGHFLTGSHLAFPPQPDYDSIPSNHLHRWHQIQQMYQSFWKRWSIDYLSRQQPRGKWKQRQPNLRENDLVLVRDDRLPPLYWRLGRVISTIHGNDKLVRVALVRTADGVIKRPITKLFILPSENSRLDT